MFEIPNINITYVGCFCLPRFKDVRSTPLVITDFQVCISDTMPSKDEVPSSVWKIPIRITMHGEENSFIEIP